MTDLRHPDLRLRDIRRIVDHHQSKLAWDAGTSDGSEWVYASLESDAHRQRLRDWLRSKQISDSADAFLFSAAPNDFTTVAWRDVVSLPEKFFGDRGFKLVSKSLDWQLDYREGGVAHFGRWPAK